MWSKNRQDVRDSYNELVKIGCVDSTKIPEDDFLYDAWLRQSYDNSPIYYRYRNTRDDSIVYINCAAMVIIAVKTIKSGLDSYSRKRLNELRNEMNR